MCYRILLADNVPQYTETLGEILEIAEFKVIKATTLAEARRVLLEERIHLAVLDNRMMDDSDENDFSGILLARDTLDDGIPKIILTSFPTYEAVRFALGPLADGLPPCVNFIDKADGIEVLLDAIHKALRAHNRINWNLEINFNEMENLSLPGLAGLLEQRIPSHFPDRIGEFTDLLRKLFDQKDQLTVVKLLWRFAGRMLLQVETYGHGMREQYLVTCGLRGKIREELKNFTLIPKNILNHLGTGVLMMENKAETSNYAGFSIPVPHGMNGEADDFEALVTYYPKHDEKQIRASLEGLLRDTLRDSLQMHEYGALDLRLGDWYAGKRDAPVDWPRILDHIAVESQRMGLPDVRSVDGKLVFRFLNGHVITLPDPYPFYTSELWLPEDRIRTGLIPGGMNVYSIAVNREGKLRLTDYYQAGYAPVWHIFANLESSIRFSLPCGNNFQELYAYETQLEQAPNLDDAVEIDHLNPDLHKLALCIQTVRAQAASYTGNEQKPYLACLYYLAMKDLVELDLSHRLMPSQVMPLLFRLLTAASILARPAPTPPLDGYPVLSVDEKKHLVKLGDRPIDLTQREFDLLSYLYQHQENVCPRKDIILTALSERQAGDAENDILNTNLARLREKIEPHKEDPVYIVTVRGVGIKLIPNPKSSEIVR